MDRVKIKTIVIGNTNIGKTSLSRVLTGEKLNHLEMTTIGVDMFELNLVSPQGKVLQFIIWDTAGQERYRTLVKSYFLRCQLCLLCFDVTSIASFNSLYYWIDQIKYSCTEPPKIILVGTKADVTSNTHVPQNKIYAFINKFDINYIETSSSTFDNIEILKKIMVDSSKDLVQINKPQINEYNNCCWGIPKEKPRRKLSIT